MPKKEDKKDDILVQRVIKNKKTDGSNRKKMKEMDGYREYPILMRCKNIFIDKDKKLKFSIRCSRVILVYFMCIRK